MRKSPLAFIAGFASIALLGLGVGVGLTVTGAAAASPYDGVNEKLIPPSGKALFGTSRFDDAKAKLGDGAHLSIAHDYFRWGEKPPLSEGDKSWTKLAAGYIPLVSWNPMTTPYTEMAAGRHDAEIDAAAARFVAAYDKFKKPVYFVFNHEADADVRNKDNGDAAGFKAAWRHVHDRFIAKGATHVVWTLIFTDMPFNDPDQPQWGANVMYPGDEYVDWIGTDPYNWYSCPAHTAKEWRDMDTLVNAVVKWGTQTKAGSHTKPLMLGEFGSVENTRDPQTPGRTKADWFNKGIDLVQKYPAVKAYVYFNNHIGPSVVCEWAFDTSPASLNAAKKFASIDYFNVTSSRPGTTTTTSRKTTTTVRNTTSTVRNTTTTVPSSSTTRPSTTSTTKKPGTTTTWPFEGDGLRAEYFSDPDFKEPAFTRIDKTVDFDWANRGPQNNESKVEGWTFSVRWSGQLIAPENGTYGISTVSDDGVRVFIDNKPVIVHWNRHGVAYDEASVTLTKGSHDIRVEYFEAWGEAKMKLFWDTPSGLEGIVPPSALKPVVKVP